MQEPEHRRTSTRRLTAAAAVAVAAAAAGALGVAGGPQRAEAGLLLDLRATALNGNPLPGGFGGKAVVAGVPGDVITLALFARVSGTNGVNDDGLQSVHGALVSSGGLLGNLSGGRVAPFNGSGSQDGSVQDLDFDTDLDIGVAPNGGTPTTGFFVARAGVLETVGTVIDADTKEFQVGQFTFTVTGNSGDMTFLNFVRRANGAGGNITTSAVWTEDGLAKNPTVSPMSSGAPVHVGAIPEPASSAAALSGLGLLRRRRPRRAWAVPIT